eukprot:TRINITY_DN705_c0_g1_i1.p1 TRINITY_DN705_c0_g1~~TRINITY_DN705_c0_g1_i1.p1  ORF type:complete len:257 (+),score=3.21 TRINITY_DN705_c0_g1_i1:68-838(+)
MHQSTLFILLAIALTIARALQCGAPCLNNGQCPDPTCNRCDPIYGNCTTGLPCAAPCVVTTDCNQSPNSTCPICRIGRCTGRGGCSDKCASNADCYAENCKTCQNGICQSLCQGPCSKDSDCNYSGSTCTICLDKVCQKGGCGSQCFLNSDCARQGNCTYCIDFVCSARCGSPCTSSNDCNGAKTGCGLCSNGVCAPSDQCGIPCPSNNGCAGNCSRCADNVCSRGFTCGTSCVVDSDCDQSDPGCRFCNSAVCGR